MGALARFVGAFVMTPVAAWVERRPSAPPALAMITPAFRLLVPGAVGFIGVAQFFGSRQDAGVGHMLDALIAFILIGIGGVRRRDARAALSVPRSAVSCAEAERVLRRQRATRYAPD